MFVWLEGPHRDPEDRGGIGKPAALGAGGESSDPWQSGGVVPCPGWGGYGGYYKANFN